MRKATAFALTVCLIWQSCAAAFNDMSNHWANAFVRQLTEQEIVYGYGDGNFRPEESVNVDELLKMILLATGETVEDNSNDWAAPYWATPYIEKAYQKDIVWYDEFDRFDRPATRAEIVRIMVRALGLSMPSTVNKEGLISRITDYYDILNHYKEYVLIGYANGLVTGYGDGSFSAQQYATRAETAVMITRMMKIKPISVPQQPGTPQAEAKMAYYVSPNGNDSNDGTEAKPFRTIARAKETLRNLENRPDGGVTVYLRGGDYEITDTLTFGTQDGGTENKPVRYTSYPGEIARLSGGKAIPFNGFEKISNEMGSKLLNKSAASKVLQVDLKKLGIDDYGKILRRGFLVGEEAPTPMELFVDGERMQLGRWPNEGYVGIGSVVRTGRRSKSDMLTGAVYEYAYDQPSKWSYDIQNIFVSGVLGPNYAYDYYPIGEINPQLSQITLREGAIQDYYSKPFIYYENIFEEIDKPGEYYVDREKGVLYLYPPVGMNSNSDIRVSMLETPLIRLEEASFIEFVNLQMDTTRGAVLRSSTTSESILIENCTIRNTGGQGITINQTKNTKIRNNHIYDLGYTGISVSGGHYASIQPGNNIIENNHIHKIAQIERSYQTAITLGYQSVGTTVRNNEIHDTPHAAIIIYGVDHTVEYNDIYRAVQEFHDMDAIYMNVYVYPWERGVVIRQNFIHDLGQGTFTERQMNIAGIRTDNNGSGLTVEENVFYNIGYKDSNQIRGVCAEGTRNVIRNNIFVDSAEGYDGPSPYREDAKFDVEGNANWKTAYEDYQKYVGAYGEKYPEILNFWNEHFLSAKKTNIYENNLVVNIKFPLSTLNEGMAPSGFRAAHELVDAKNNYATSKDPGFKDYANQNFSLNADSEVFTKIDGFKEIEFEKMGIPSEEKVGVSK